MIPVKKSFLRHVRGESTSNPDLDKNEDINSGNKGYNTPTVSKLLYIPSVANEGGEFTKKPEEEGFNIKAVLMPSKTKSSFAMNHSTFLRDIRKKNNYQQTTMLRYIRSGKSLKKINGNEDKETGSVSVKPPAFSISSPLFINSNGINGNDEVTHVHTKENSSDENGDTPIKRSNLNRRKHYNIDSDDESLLESKRHKPDDPPNLDTAFKPEFPTNPQTLSQDTIENLIESYSDLYPEIDKMEIFDYLRELNYNFHALTKKLDLIRKLDKNKSIKPDEIAEEKRIRQLLRSEEKKKQVVEREDIKNKKSIERLKNRKIWQMKGRKRQDFEDDDEEDFVKAVRVYDSDSSDEEEQTDANQDSAKIESRGIVYDFYKDSSINEIIAVPGCSKKKAMAVIESRPFDDWDDLVLKFKQTKFLSTDLLNSAAQLITMKEIVAKLMKKCEQIAFDIRSAVSSIVDDAENEENCKIMQPSILNNSLSLKGYQIIGLNWLVLMHQQGLNGVLADEMGLGKTIQAISFLAYLLEQDKLDALSLIVVPSSTVENWAKELELWCPSLGFLIYHGSQEERRGMRGDIVSDKLDENVYVILTTYAMVSSTSEDRGLFKKIVFHTVIFDEAHMLKNMATQRFESLMKIRAQNRLLLTGTPLQNNLVELMSILVFVMPQLFEGKKEMLKKIFSMFPKSDSDDNRGQYERKRIEQAHRIMKPFFLRRLKIDVLKELPNKESHILHVPMSDSQEKIYKETIKDVNRKAAEIKKEILNSKEDEISELTKDMQNKSNKDANSSSHILMTLRKICNHPLLVRSLYTDEKIYEISRILQKTTHRQSLLEYIKEDLCIMSDFEIHKTCHMYRSISHFCLPDKEILNSGKFIQLDEMLHQMKGNGDRVLIFSQFCIVLDIIEDFMTIKGYRYHRLDGRTLVPDRQEKIDNFNESDDTFAFLLSTRAGGLGINLSAANKVILHDIDFNPYNDKQAEDRCHRVGQTRTVTVYRYLSKDTIEEGIHTIASNKLQLGKDVTEVEGSRKADFLHLLESALSAH